MGICSKIIQNRITFGRTYVHLLFYSAFFCASIYLIDRRIRQNTENNLCLKELQIGRTLNGLNITSSNKQDIIQQFLSRYDVDLNQNVSGMDGGAIAADWMTCHHVTPDDGSQLGAVLKWLSVVPITKIFGGVTGQTGKDWTGTTAKLDFRLKGGYRALFKPKVQEIDSIVSGLSKFNMGGERYFAEIASFHLQRILGYNRAPLVVGRKINLVKEIVNIADNINVKNVFEKEDKTCVHVEYGRVNTSFCGKNGYLEGALILWLPKPLNIIRVHTPLKNKTRTALPWNEIHDNLNWNPQRILDYVDFLIFDYLIQNIDRSHYFTTHSDYSPLFSLDQGRSFTDYTSDFKKALELFQQKCHIRYTTYKRLKQLRGGILSQVLSQIISRDPVAPILVKEHLTSLDRRLEHVLQTIESCVKNQGSTHVFYKVELSLTHVYDFMSF